MGFEAPVSYENTWEALKVEGQGRGGHQFGSNTLIPMKGTVLTGICSDWLVWLHNDLRGGSPAWPAYGIGANRHLGLQVRSWWKLLQFKIVIFGGWNKKQCFNNWGQWKQSVTEVATSPDHAFTNVLSACTLTSPFSMRTHAPQSAMSHPVCPVNHRGVFESVSHASLAFLLCAVHIFVLNTEVGLPPLIYLCIISRVPSISSENVSIQWKMAFFKVPFTQSLIYSHHGGPYWHRQSWKWMPIALPWRRQTSYLSIQSTASWNGNNKTASYGWIELISSVLLWVPQDRITFHGAVTPKMMDSSFQCPSSV